MTLHRTLAGPLAALLLAAACVLPASAQTLRLRLSADPETLYNVQSISNIVDGVVGTFLTERLVYLDASGQPQPWLAERWAIAADQKSVTFQLRQGVKFHDGTAFDAAAVKFHFDSILDPRNTSPVRPSLGPLEGVDVLDTHTVRLRFTRPYGPLFNNLSLGFMGFNSPTAVKALGRGYGRRPVGTGPFRFVSWQPGREIRLERYEGYRSGRADARNPGPAHAKTVVLRVVREDTVAAEALEAGELTAASLLPDAVPRLEADPRFRVIKDSKTRGLGFIDANQRRPPLDDPAFRRALSQAIDRQAVVRGAFGGYATPMTVPLAPGIPGHDAALAAKAELGYAPDRARAALRAAGWVPGPDGVLQRQGRAARFVLRGVAGSDVIDRALAIVQSNLKAVGIEVRIETSDWGAFYPALLKDDWDLAMMGWTWPDGSVMGNLWRSPGHRQHLRPSPELDATFDRCDTTLDPAARNRCLAQAQALMVAQVTTLPVHSAWILYAVQAGVQDYHLDGNGYLLPGDVKVPR